MRNEIYPIRTGKLKFISQNDERGEPKPKHRMHYQLGASIIKRNSHSDQVSEQRREQYPHSLPLPAGQEHHRDAPLLHGLTLTKPKKKKTPRRQYSTFTWSTRKIAEASARCHIVPPARRRLWRRRQPNPISSRAAAEQPHSSHLGHDKSDPHKKNKPKASHQHGKQRESPNRSSAS